MTELFELLKEPAITAGIDIRYYYDYTYSEITDTIHAYNKKTECMQRYNAMNGYNVARLTASFIGCIFSGDSIPSIESVYPNLTDSNDNTNADNYMNNQLIALKERLLDFANERNKQHKENNENKERGDNI